MSTVRVMVGVVGFLLLVVSGAVAQGERPDGRSFRVEWATRDDPGSRPAIEGYVYNESSYRVGSVRLRLELVDAASKVVGERFVWVYGHVPARGRTQFVAPPPGAGHTYRISVESFDLIAREFGGGSESP